MHKSPIKIYQGGFLLCVWGFVLFAASDTYSGNFRVGNLFLSQNEDSVNTKCKAEELREVLQWFVWLNWNKCWFVQKKKPPKTKPWPFWILLVLAFYFLSLLKQNACLLTSEICSPSCGALWQGCSNVHSQLMCWVCSHCAMGQSGRQENEWMKSSA